MIEKKSDIKENKAGLMLKSTTKPVIKDQREEKYFFQGRWRFDKDKKNQTFTMRTENGLLSQMFSDNRLFSALFDCISISVAVIWW